jgi:hypothetical protein
MLVLVKGGGPRMAETSFKLPPHIPKPKTEKELRSINPDRFVRVPDIEGADFVGWMYGGSHRFFAVGVEAQIDEGEFAFVSGRYPGTLELLQANARGGDEITQALLARERDLSQEIVRLKSQIADAEAANAALLVQVEAHQARALKAEVALKAREQEVAALKAPKKVPPAPPVPSAESKGA